MEMKESTIIDKYTRAGVSITILAELNACQKEDIEKILTKAKAKPKPHKKRGKNMTATQKAKHMPDIVLNAVIEKLDDIEKQIKYHEEAKKS